jgi:hypothetical protein
MMRRVVRIALKPATARALERASKKLVDALGRGEDPGMRCTNRC